MSAICCGFTPMLLGSKAIKLVQGKTSQITKVYKNQRRKKGSKTDNSPPLACNFIMMMELRKKIITFRDIIDLPLCNTTLSTVQMIIRTMRDLHKYYPESIPRYRRKKFKRLPLDKILIYFCKALHDLADLSKMSIEGVDKCKFDINDHVDCQNVEKLVEIVVGTLNGLIKIGREKCDTNNEDEDSKGLCEKANNPYSEKSYGYPSPTSVLPHEFMNASPLLLALNVQAMGKLNTIDLKRLKLHMIPNIKDQIPSFLKQNKKVIIEEQNEEGKGDVVNETRDCNSQNETLNNASGDGTTNQGSNVAPTIPPSEMIPPILLGDVEDKSPSPPLAEFVQVAEDKTVMPTQLVQVGEDVSESPSSPPMPVEVVSIIPPPPPPPCLRSNVLLRKLPPPPPSQPTLVAKETELPSPESALTKTKPTGVPSPPPQPPPQTPPPRSESGTTLPPPPPPPRISPQGIAPPPPPPMMLSKGSRPLDQPPTPANGAAPPPPPPGGLRLKKANTKLKRSSHMSNLYRNLKGKVEGIPVRDPSSCNGRKTGGGNNGVGKQGQGMADALAEMTKRSTYFIQIEEDVEKYEKSIKELRTSISTFKTSDMPELLKFHKYVESILENLTDETQVLARFEGFPRKKLEALRTASTLYSKLESMLSELQNWKIEPPLAQLLERVERYFDKMKKDIDSLERTKDEESKKLKGHNIEFDFQILVRIKEAMVDVSSNCMEYAMKERREAKLAENEAFKTKGDGTKKVCSKMLWRAFQFAFRVYTFAGGHDDRADRLTRELAHEIETDPEHQQ